MMMPARIAIVFLNIRSAGSATVGEQRTTEAYAEKVMPEEYRRLPGRVLRVTQRTPRWRLNSRLHARYGEMH